MGFFSSLFGHGRADRSAPDHAPITASAPTKIGYDPKLIDILHAHHAQLGKIFARIGKAAEDGDIANVRDNLRRFKTSLEAHLLTENVRFYGYLEQKLAADAENLRTLHSFRKEMNTIASSVLGFDRRWQNAEIGSADMQNQFLSEYREIGKLLEQRLDNEESSLYPMYGP
jgi:hypothetical protein